MDDINVILEAITFAADRHKNQRRKGRSRIPYINHPLSVMKILASHGETECDLLVAAVLHDIIEDTAKNVEEIKKLSNEILIKFGENVLLAVLEVSDNKALNVDERKAIQLEITSSLSDIAKKIRIADKTANLIDVRHDPPIGWSRRRKVAYIEWSKKVIDRARGVNEHLEAYFDKVASDALQKIY